MLGIFMFSNFVILFKKDLDTTQNKKTATF